MANMSRRLDRIMSVTNADFLFIDCAFHKPNLIFALADTGNDTRRSITSRLSRLMVE